jgi:hypothetical protein
MNIADLNDADLQALDELNRRYFQAMDPLLRDGARAGKTGPKGNLGVNPSDDGALDDVASRCPACPSWRPPTIGWWQPVRDVVEKLGGGAQT